MGSLKGAWTALCHRPHSPHFSTQKTGVGRHLHGSAFRRDTDQWLSGFWKAQHLWVCLILTHLSPQELAAEGIPKNPRG